MEKPRPWVNGLIDGISASNLIRFSNIEHKNRIAFIVLDSTLEIALKKFITNVKKIEISDESVWKSRERVNGIVKRHTTFDKEVWENVDFYYKVRTGLYHEDSEKTVTDGIIDDFQELVEFFINNLFNIHCSQLVPLTLSLIPQQNEEEQTKIGEPTKEPTQIIEKLSINKIREKINIIVVAVGDSQSKSYDDILEVLKRKGFRGKLDRTTMSVYMNNLYKHMFYFDEYWKLTEDEGLPRYQKLKGSYSV